MRLSLPALTVYERPLVFVIVSAGCHAERHALQDHTLLPEQ
jgi:hypothetical protein